LGHGLEYRYPHDFAGAWVEQRYLPEGVEADFYEGTDHGAEGAIVARWRSRTASDQAAKAPPVE
jgi:putative ATPase